MVRKEDVILAPILDNEKVYDCMKVSLELIKSMIDRSDLHKRGEFERFINISMGEIAESAFIKWLRDNGKYAESAVDKHSNKPDKGYDVFLNSNGKPIECSIKSSLSVFKSDIDDVLDNFTISTKQSEIRDVNVQIYFWLNLNGKPRYTVPSELNMAIIGWLGKNDFSNIAFESYATEHRQAPVKKLRDIRTMNSLLDWIS